MYTIFRIFLELQEGLKKVIDTSIQLGIIKTNWGNPEVIKDGSFYLIVVQNWFGESPLTPKSYGRFPIRTD